MSRVVPAASLVYAQVDFYQSGINRQTGITVSSIAASLFTNNNIQSWTLADGTSVADSSISAGIIYFNEIASSPGFYSVRFYPSSIGYWRLALVNVSLTQQVILDFDVIPAQGSSGNSLNASFLPVS